MGCCPGRCQGTSPSEEQGRDHPWVRQRQKQLCGAEWVVGLVAEKQPHAPSFMQESRQGTDAAVKLLWPPTQGHLSPPSPPAPRHPHGQQRSQRTELFVSAAHWASQTPRLPIPVVSPALQSPRVWLLAHVHSEFGAIQPALRTHCLCASSHPLSPRWDHHWPENVAGVLGHKEPHETLPSLPAPCINPDQSPPVPSAAAHTLPLL